ncbi:MAG: hypothetical protein ACD_47C00412G0001, partial [uncultured bacterium]
MGKVTAEDRPAFGEKINRVKEKVESGIKEFEKKISDKAVYEKINASYCDVTLPGKFHEIGHRHPISSTIAEIVEIFG